MPPGVGGAPWAHTPGRWGPLPRQGVRGRGCVYVCVCFGEGILSPRIQKCPGFWRLEGARECELKFPHPSDEALPTDGHRAASWRRRQPPGLLPEAGAGSLRAPRLLQQRSEWENSSLQAELQGLLHLREQPGDWSSLLPAAESRHAGLRSSSYLSGGAHPLESVGDFISYQSQRAVCIRTLATEAVLIKRRISALAGAKGSRGNLRTSKSTFSQL